MKILRNDDTYRNDFELFIYLCPFNPFYTFYNYPKHVPRLNHDGVLHFLKQPAVTPSFLFCWLHTNHRSACVNIFLATSTIFEHPQARSIRSPTPLVSVLLRRQPGPVPNHLIIATHVEISRKASPIEWHHLITNHRNSRVVVVGSSQTHHGVVVVHPHRRGPETCFPLFLLHTLELRRCGTRIRSLIVFLDTQPQPQPPVLAPDSKHIV